MISWGCPIQMSFLNYFSSEASPRQTSSQYIDFNFNNNVRMQEQFGYRTPAQAPGEALTEDIAAQYPIAPS